MSFLAPASMDSISVSLFFSLSFLISITHQTGATSSSMHERLTLNTPIVKTITTGDGDIFDCVDIHKQPSLDHPLLQNHTLQMKPTFVLDGFNGSAHQDTYPDIGLENGGCPDGSVPIRRIQEEEHRRFQSYLMKYPSSISPNDSNDANKPGWHYAISRTAALGIGFHGVRGVFNVYSPGVSKGQHSDSLLYISRGILDERNMIIAGWSSFPALYGDNKPRLHTQWTTNNFKTSCTDIRCKGFVQIDQHLPLGRALTPTSIYGGKQYDFPITINQDQTTGNWWMIASFNVIVGYWPKELFTGLASYGDEAGWGGRVYSPIPYESPLMGSGHFPDQGLGKACYIKQMQYVRGRQGEFEDFKISDFLKRVSRPDCYDLSMYLDYHSMCNMLFGGPGGNCGWP